MKRLDSLIGWSQMNGMAKALLIGFALLAIWGYLNGGYDLLADSGR